jgi:hypothetical protein
MMLPPLPVSVCAGAEIDKRELPGRIGPMVVLRRDEAAIALPPARPGPAIPLAAMPAGVDSGQFDL